jgi:serine/threonine-protein kinase RsbW
MRVVETLSVPGTLPGVRQAIQAFDAFGRLHEVRQDAAWRFLLALDEILSNIVRHGLGRRDAPIDLTFSVDDGLIAVEIVDTSEAFDPLLVPAPDTSSPLDQRRPGGLGIALVRQLMDETQYERRNGRNHFVMRWRPHADC